MRTMPLLEETREARRYLYGCGSLIERGVCLPIKGECDGHWRGVSHLLWLRALMSPWVLPPLCVVVPSDTLTGQRFRARRGGYPL